jgi:hypothetical protein
MADNGKTGVPIRVRLYPGQMAELKKFRKRGENLSAALRRGLDVAFTVASLGKAK